MNKLPQVRNNDILVQSLGNEILIYDLKMHQAYNLNETSAIIYQACGDKLTFDELKSKHSLTDEIIYFALDRLKANNLIEGYESNYFAGLSRREVIRKVGLASMIALPVISGLVAPYAVEAQSGSSGGSCMLNACIPPGGNICAGCVGRTIGIKYYTGGVGCAGGGFDSTQACTGAFPNATAFPAGITSVT